MGEWTGICLSLMVVGGEREGEWERYIGSVTIIKSQVNVVAPSSLEQSLKMKMTNGNHDSRHPGKTVPWGGQQAPYVVLVLADGGGSSSGSGAAERKLRSYLASCRDTIFYHSQTQGLVVGLAGSVCCGQRHKVIIAFAAGRECTDSGQP